ncbi:MAG: mucoidy inhibitor MuiA family protein [Candidatus Sericytochromatia bacterium]|nr:mucoidy inhibitor MuiA family protein [Candidatus Sericytochromatia bacterium]
MSLARTSLLTAMLLAGLAPGATAASTRVLDAAGRIVGVTVYPDRAVVRREAELDLAAGEYRVAFTRLPRELDANALRVSGEGTARVLLHGSDVRVEAVGSPPHARVAELEKRLAALGDRDRALADQRAVHQRQLDTVVETSDKAAGGLAGQLSAGKANVETWKGLLSFLEARQAGQAKAIQVIDRQRRDIAKELDRVRAELNRLRGFRKEEFSRIEVLVEVLQAGKLTLDVEYGLDEASWSPSHDARLDARGNALEWRSYGVVRQSTGEDWRGVALTLSTARPAAGSTPPEPVRWFLSKYLPYPESAMMAPSGAAPAPGRRPRASAKVAELGAREELSDGAPRVRANEAVAVASNQGTSVALDIPRAVDVPSDGQPHQVPIGSIAMKAETSYRVVPRVTTDAFLEMKATHPGPWPLLPGPVKAFVGRDHVGTVGLGQEVSPTQSFTLPMGVDRSIAVKRARLSKRTGTDGLLQKRGFASYRYEVLVTNYKALPQAVRVVESIPQTSEEEVTVTLQQVTPTPLADQPPGQVAWQLQVQPGEKKTIGWGYRVEWPAEVRITGLE